MDIIDIKGIDKAELLVALHKGTQAAGMGRLHDRGPISKQQAQDLLDMQSAPSGTNGRLAISETEFSFDYVAGRPIKVTFKGDELHHARLYDRDAPGGEGACQRIVDSLKRYIDVQAVRYMLS